MKRDTKTKNTHLDLLRNRGGGYATIYCPSFKPGDKILVRDSDLDQWEEGTVCEGFWHCNFCTVDAITSKGQGRFKQFRPLVLEESEHFPVKGFKVKVIDGVIQLHTATLRIRFIKYLLKNCVFIDIYVFLLLKSINHE